MGIDTPRHTDQTEVAGRTRLHAIHNALRAHGINWNRLGLPTRQQSILAWAARTAILGPPPEATPRAATAMRKPRQAPPPTSPKLPADSH